MSCGVRERVSRAGNWEEIMQGKGVRRAGIGSAA
ncbi:hypothetical protein SAMN05421504_107145 [Amycolatopsis xylanica]|uniref:Uncharacterized protein n=1 Tax=Amycolatopsis xylanica TaxID=589385 RepID=A0A1H3N6X4_9PSEU|nr:hypothetical protein SAMN05421504_107145 [Amycolatopsis xylanica]